ncbi:MAG: AraC family transcriptional regulator, partial [Hungatella sp.]
YIDQHLSEALSLESISTACSLDKYYLSHLFKKETESTIFQYILVKRIAQAKELLSLGSSVTEACQQSGFNDYANFIRSFKKVTGYSPGHFKKLNHHSF